MPLTEHQPWAASASCAQTDPDLFHEDPTGGYSNKILTAKLVCQDCPVRQQCLTQALKNNEEWGIWGGKTPDERAAINDGAPIHWDRILCKRGHDIAKVGRAIGGECKICLNTRTAKRQQTYRDKKAAKQSTGLQHA